MIISIDGIPWRFTSEASLLRVLAWFHQRSGR